MIGIKTADIYLHFPCITGDEADELGEFLEEENIEYEGATDIVINLLKENEQLKNDNAVMKAGLIQIRDEKLIKYEIQRKELISWLESKNNITLTQHKTIEPVIKIQDVIDKIKEMD